MINAMAEYLKFRNVPAVNLSGVSAPTTLFQYVRFALAGLPLPKTIYLGRAALAGSYAHLVAQLDLPFVLKPNNSSGGWSYCLIRNESDFRCRLESSGPASASFLAQEFIPHEAISRLLVLGSEVRLIAQRLRPGGIDLAGEAQGRPSLAEAAAFDPDAVQLANRAARLMRSDIAAVTLCQHLITRAWYVLGVDPNPVVGAGLFASHELETYARYVQNRLGRAWRRELNCAND